MRLGIIVALSLTTAIIVHSQPSGHNRPIFELPNFKGNIEERKPGDIPSPFEFYSKYATGWGKPFIMRGAVKDTEAFRKWQTDEDLGRHYPSARFNQIEFAKKETRAAGSDSWTMKKFLERYKSTDAYAVSQVPKEMAKDVELPDLLKCGYASQYLDVHNFWFSSGGTKSVIHNDDQDNINCVYSGTKRFFMVDARNKTHIENSQLGWTIAGEEQQKDPGYQGYGAFGGGMDVDKMDLIKYPRWADVPWYNASLKAGDCLFIPTSWYHQVLSPAGERSIALNIWWWRKDAPLDEAELNSCKAKERKVSLADCKFGYEGPPEQGMASKPAESRVTSCKGIPQQKPASDAWSWITKWQRFAERSLFAALKSEGIDEFNAPIEDQVRLMEKHSPYIGIGDKGYRGSAMPQGEEQDDDDGADDDEKQDL